MSDSDFHPRLSPIGELFDDSGTVYTVPVYQRNFAWGAEQIEQLINDIQDASAAHAEGYFLGNLVVTERPSKDTDFEVIDGQQRLTTLHLLLTALAESGAAPSAAHVGRLRYESRPRATEALRRIAVESALPDSGESDSGNIEDSRIQQGLNVIRQYLVQNVPADGERDRFADYLRNKVTVVIAPLPHDIDLNRYFEVMNTRGQQLSQVDIVKARLMSRLNDDAERSCFAWVWNACADMDSYVQMSLTRGNTTQRSYIFGDTWSWFVLDSFKDLIEIHQPDHADETRSDTTSPLSTSLTLDQALAAYAATRPPTLTEDPDNIRFRSPIEFPIFLLHVLMVFQRDREEKEGNLDDKRLITRFEEVFDQDTSIRVQDFIVELLRCRNLFDSYILKREYTAANEDGDWSLQRLIKRESRGHSTPGYVNTYSVEKIDVEDGGEVDPATKDLLILQSMLRVTYTAPRTMNWITKILQVLTDTGPGRASKIQLASVLRDFARSKVQDAYFVGEEPTGFGISRIVFTYLDYLLLAQNKDPDFRFAFRNSIEHFYPQHPDIQQTGSPVSDKNLHRLGNLALVSVGANSKFSNSLPKAKAENYSATIEAQSPKLKKMAQTTRNDGWGDSQVREHHAEIVAMLRDDVSQLSTGQDRVR